MFVVRKIFMDYVVPDKKRRCMFCLYCRYCHKHNTFLQAANKCDDAFTTRGFDIK